MACAIDNKERNMNLSIWLHVNSALCRDDVRTRSFPELFSCSAVPDPPTSIPATCASDGQQTTLQRPMQADTAVPWAAMAGPRAVPRAGMAALRVVLNASMAVPRAGMAGRRTVLRAGMTGPRAEDTAASQAATGFHRAAAVTSRAAPADRVGLCVWRSHTRVPFSPSAGCTQ